MLIAQLQKLPIRVLVSVLQETGDRLKHDNPQKYQEAEQHKNSQQIDLARDSLHPIRLHFFEHAFGDRFVVFELSGPRHPWELVQAGLRVRHIFNEIYLALEDPHLYNLIAVYYPLLLFWLFLDGDLTQLGWVVSETS